MTFMVFWTPPPCPLGIFKLAHVDKEGEHGGGALDEEVAASCVIFNIFTRSPLSNFTLCWFLSATLTL